MSESYNPQETGPNIPEDPKVAAEEFASLWLSRGGWNKDKSWVEMNDDEKEERRKNSAYNTKKFRWLAETLDSEALWHQATVPTNYGVIHCFRFSPQDDTGEEELPPNAYVYFPTAEEKIDEGILILQSGGIWRKEDLNRLYNRTE